MDILKHPENFPPSWLKNLIEPVPLTRGIQFFQVEQQTISQMLQEIDGHASIEQAATRLSAKFVLPVDEFRSSLVRMLGRFSEKDANQTPW
jgi:hypothetical protein